MLHLLCCICCVAFAVAFELQRTVESPRFALTCSTSGPPRAIQTTTLKTYGKEIERERKKERDRERERHIYKEREREREREKERERGGSERAREKSFLNYLKFAHHFSQFPNLKERCALACRLPITYLVPPTQLAMYLCPHRRQLLHYYAR